MPGKWNVWATLCCYLNKQHGLVRHQRYTSICQAVAHLNKLIFFLQGPFLNENLFWKRNTNWKNVYSPKGFNKHLKIKQEANLHNVLKLVFWWEENNVPSPNCPEGYHFFVSASLLHQGWCQTLICASVRHLLMLLDWFLFFQNLYFVSSGPFYICCTILTLLRF